MVVNKNKAIDRLYGECSKSDCVKAALCFRIDGNANNFFTYDTDMDANDGQSPLFALPFDQWNKPMWRIFFRRAERRCFRELHSPVSRVEAVIITNSKNLEIRYII